MSARRIISAALLAFAAACANPAAQDPASAEVSPLPGVVMDAASQQRVGVTVTAIERSSAPRLVDAYARIMDVSPLAALDADVQAGAAAARASNAEYRRLLALAEADQAASQRAVEAARAQANADSSQAALASRRIALEWGGALAVMSNAERARLLNDVATGRAALVRVDLVNDEVTPTGVEIQEDENQSIAVSLLGRAGPADQRLQTVGYLAVLRGEAAGRLPAGRLVPARITTGGEQMGFLIPENAIVRVDQVAYVYVQIAADRFERRQLVDPHPASGGMFVLSGFNEGDKVATGGAAALYAADLGPIEAE